MRQFNGTIKTDRVGSDCEFEFEAEDDATENLKKLEKVLGDE